MVKDRNQSPFQHACKYLRRLTVFWHSLKLGLSHCMRTHSCPSVKYITGISVLQVKGPVSLLCKWLRAAQIEIWYGYSFVNLMNSLKPCYYITLLRAPLYQFHGYHLSLYNMRYRCRISFPHLRCSTVAGLVCLLSPCSSCGQETGSHSGQWHQAATVSWVKNLWEMKDYVCLDIHTRYRCVLCIPDFAWGYPVKVT